jgi:hypothetical protein
MSCSGQTNYIPKMQIQCTVTNDTHKDNYPFYYYNSHYWWFRGQAIHLSSQDYYKDVIGRAGASPPSRATGAQFLLGERDLVVQPARKFYIYIYITGYGSTLYIGIAMVFVFSPYIWKFTSCFQFQVNLTFNDFIAQNMSKVICVPNISLNYHFLAKL